MKSARRLVLLLLLLTVGISGQELVSSKLNGRMTAGELNERIEKLYAKYPVGRAGADVELHKITYSSLDANNRRTTLSGLVAIPAGGAPKGLVVFCHGTTVDRGRSPSRFSGKGEAPETVDAIAAFASGGYAVVLPDYLGMGDHDGAHPYPLSNVNARAGMDIISAVRAFARRQSYTIGKELFITGYSEGGGVAMALTKLLQSYMNPEYQVTRSAPASGPYDLSGTTREFMLQETGEQTGFVLRLYLLASATHYLNKERGIKLNTIYKPALANAIGLSFRLSPTDEGLIRNIGVTTTLMRSKDRLANVLQPAFLTQVRENDQRNAFVRSLKENDVYDWTPRVPMLLIALEGDAIVSIGNTDKAYVAMRRRGVDPAAMRRITLRDPSLNHLNAVAPAMSKARAFFDRGFAGVVDVQ